MSGNPTDCKRCGKPHPRCKGHNKAGEPCMRHPKGGVAVCPRHGGHAPQVIAAAERRQEQAAALAAVATYGLPREVAPDVALLEEVHRTAGHVAWLADVVGQLERDELTWGLAEETDAPVTDNGGGVTSKHKAAVNVWVKLYQDERRHLAAVCRDALAAGIAERQVRLAEQQGALLAGAVGRILEGLGLSAEQWERVPQVVPGVLRSITGGEQ